MVSIGIGAAIGSEIAARLAPEIEAAGFHALWVNDIPGADALAVLEAAAKTTTHLTLATGVLPVDRRPANRIAEQVNGSALPQERLVLGIGSGAASIGALRLVADAAAELRKTVPAKVVVGALGPKMRRLAVESADGALFSWLTPEVAAQQSAEARMTAFGGHLALYVRTALEPDARQRMDVEMGRYAAIPSYAANFARHRMAVDDTVLDADIHPLAERLDEYRNAVDEVVLRAITPADGVDDYLRFVEAARALL
ncbi:hypothetical protein GCM10009777_01670 [Microbacterium pumilum]|uniref:Luciferase-like domain-containing protein n=2 Tax=Microbacterium pumilum TaxID=344165 RepID=A0ABP5D4A9_9MICO